MVRRVADSAGRDAGGAVAGIAAVAGLHLRRRSQFTPEPARCFAGFHRID